LRISKATSRKSSSGYIYIIFARPPSSPKRVYAVPIYLIKFVPLIFFSLSVSLSSSLKRITLRVTLKNSFVSIAHISGVTGALSLHQSVKCLSHTQVNINLTDARTLIRTYVRARARARAKDAYGSCRWKRHLVDSLKELIAAALRSG